jgi:hypothetical protein
VHLHLRFTNHTHPLFFEIEATHLFYMLLTFRTPIRSILRVGTGREEIAMEGSLLLRNSVSMVMIHRKYSRVTTRGHAVLHKFVVQS